MRKTYQYRLYPNKAQAVSLTSSLNACRWVYNKTLEIRRDAWEQNQESLSLYDTNAFIVPWKKEQPTLRDAHSQCLQNAQLRVDLAFKAFFRRIKSGDKPGYPRFKGEHYDSITFPQSGFKIVKKYLSVSKVGDIKIKLHRKPKGVIKTLNIRRTATNKWFASFSCEIKVKKLKKSKEAIGIDVGLIDFAYLSNGENIPAPKFFRQDEKVLAKAQRRLSKAEKGTLDRKEQRKKVAHIHERIANRRKDFAHQLSRKIINRFGIICVEDLTINRMVHNHCLAKSITDAAWSQFFQYLLYKAENAGRVIVKVNPAYTSQTCSKCGHRKHKDLSEREHVCECCGFKINRDHNAALNILALGMQSLASA